MALNAAKIEAMKWGALMEGLSSNDSLPQSGPKGAKIASDLDKVARGRPWIKK